jgi:hypothetical protein
MWKIVLGFVLFAGLAVFVLMKGGGTIDMGGEKHAIEVPEAAPSGASAASH